MDCHMSPIGTVTGMGPVMVADGRALGSRFGRDRDPGHANRDDPSSGADPVVPVGATLLVIAVFLIARASGSSDRPTGGGKTRSQRKA